MDFSTIKRALAIGLLIGSACGDRPSHVEPTAGDGAAGGMAQDGDGTAGDGAAGGMAQDGGCDPIVDRCPAGSYCQFIAGDTRCIEEGENTRDAPCPDGRCSRGSMCMPGSFSSGLTCQQPCIVEQNATQNACELRRHTCFDAVTADGAVLPFGLCRYVE